MLTTTIVFKRLQNGEGRNTLAKTNFNCARWLQTSDNVIKKAGFLIADIGVDGHFGTRGIPNRTFPPVQRVGAGSVVRGGEDFRFPILKHRS